MTVFRGLVMVLAAAGAPLAAAHAASERRVPSPLDARVVHRAAPRPADVPRPLSSLPSADRLRAGWEAFDASHGGDWTIHLDGTTALPTLVSGRGIAWLPEGEPGTTVDQLDVLARRFLTANAALLGEWSDLLELDREASVLLRPDHWQLVYRLRVGGVRVDEARLDLHVVQGRMVMMGGHLWARPRISGVPALDAAVARGVLDGWLGPDRAALRPDGEPELAIVPLESGPGISHVLVWRLPYRDASAPTRWTGEVDAHDGSIVSFEETTQYGAIVGGVYPAANDGDCLRGGCELPGVPMPFADYTEAGQPEKAADDYGNLACLDPGGTIETNLSGPYVRISDVCGTIAQTGTCGGLDLGAKAGENCAVAPGSSPGNTSAARTAFYHVNRAAETARFYDAANAWIRGPLTTNVNQAGTCNANWDGTNINFYRAGGGCSNMGENPDIVVHEWGHGYDSKDGGGPDKPSEAYSDITAILHTRDSCMGNGSYTGGTTCSGYGDACLTCTGFREMDWDARASHTPATPYGWVAAHCPSDTSQFSGPCRREAHCESHVASEAMYDLAVRDLPASGMDQATAWETASRLWYLTRPGSGGDAYTCGFGQSSSCAATSWYQRMRVADDNDGNLANGTPHAAALFAAFKRHNIACGAAGDATNQSTTNCPPVAAPVVTRTMTPAGVQLSWGPVANAAEYRVYRGEMGCDRAMVPIASLPSSQTTYVDDSADSDALRRYRVQAFGTNRACFSPVSACVSAPPGSRLAMTSHRVVDDGDGVPEPGETLTLPVTLWNWGIDPATAPTATVGLVGPGDVRVLRPTASWPAIAPDTTAESSAPHLQVVVLEEASCGQVLDLSLQGAAGNSDPFTGEIVIPMGSPTRDYPEETIVPIPFVTPAPVTATWNVPDAKTIADLDVTLDIFHQDPTQIVVELTSPLGTTVRLHDRGPGSGHGIETRFDRDTPPSGPGTMADFAGQSTLGTWTISVQDLDGSGVTTDGYIRPRSLNVTVHGAFDCEPQVCPEPRPTAAPGLTVTALAGGDLELAWSAVPGSGYHVLQSADPAFRSGVATLASTTATSFTLPVGSQGSAALTFFQVRAVNACHQEGP